MVYVTEADYERLANLAESVESRGARLLAEELERAVILHPDELPRAFVRLGSRVRFTDLTTGRTRTVQVVPPQDADIDQDRLSVLSLVGAALIGLRAGESIGLNLGQGPSHVLVVESVEAAHELA
jgi:regulator of nucleoside diphosphate kinase